MQFELKDYTQALWTSQEAEIITGGRSTTPWRAMNLSIRQQDIYPGDLFFASQGDNIELAFEQGAAAVAVQDGMNVPAHIMENYPVMHVPCVYESLRDLARAARFRTHSLVIAVQGFEQRRALSNALCTVSDIYEGGRHLSSSLAAMPEDCDFSLFGMSPSLCPDVVIINKASQIRDLSIFNEMPASAIALINSEDEACLDIMATLKAAGVSNILTFGNGAVADARVLSQIVADNGVQTVCDILGQQICVTTDTHTSPHMPSMAQSMNMLLVAYALVKMADMPLQKLAQEMAESYMGAFDANTDKKDTKVSLIRGVGASLADPHEAIFRVKNMIDTGKGRRALVLDQAAPEARIRDFGLPARLGGLDLLCAGKKASIFKNARKAVEGMLKIKSLNEIVPDVLTPGDYVVFKSGSDRRNAIFSEALRPQL
jgi:hypothetical protein